MDGLGPLQSRKPLHEQYGHIIKIDQQMRQLVSRIPPFLLRDNAKEAETRPWLDVARRSLAITAADKVCPPTLMKL
jgi:hypothetical protein